MSDNPVICTYECEISIGGPPAHKEPEVLAAMNRAWGFEDGNCNAFDEKGQIVAKPGGDRPALIEAIHNLKRHTRLTIKVSLHKNGEKTYALV